MPETVPPGHLIPNPLNRRATLGGEETTANPALCRATNNSISVSSKLYSSLCERCDVGYEDPLLGPKLDDDLAIPGLDDLSHAELGVPDPLPCTISRGARCGPLESSSTGQRRAPASPTGRSVGNRAGLER